MMRWIAGLAAALLLPACGGGNGSGGSTATSPDGGDPAAAPAPAVPATGQAPGIRIIRPDSGASVPEGSKITIEAEVTNPTAHVARVEFYDDNQLIGSAASPPYTLSVERVKEGSHQLCAVAVDDNGNTTPSVPVTLFVVQGDGGAKKDDERRGHDH
jgi:hypothetical protein